ncbi:Glycosyltransferase involved in cell wall bisynthesis [Vreelandella subterranea]|uniref:Glycosyltransferase involved in cell wall bisynthesis n=1 Tax=Vreelandella subterranea TaxID=416874 RepID=A0A1H9RR69_9GAMM|nr:glycosyltransferase family 4 protein [Halomonas subterranea]SER75310.1 Glycosyltransferase involved in cell wall bisynthesis [Halomonas subterranea]
MNVLFFIGSLTGGGAERVTVGLANYLVRNGHRASLVTMHDSDRDFYIPNNAVNRVCLDLASENRGLAKFIANWKRLRALRHVIRAEQPEVVVGMTPTATILCILACFGIGTRVVGSERNYPGRKPIGTSWSLLRRLFYRFADAHVAQTREGADWIIRHAAARNVAVIPNAVAWPIPNYHPLVDSTSFVSSERRIVLAVGSKSEQKGFDLLLEAFIRIAPDHPDWDLAIVGLASTRDENTGARGKLQLQAEKKGMSERVHFPGLVGNVGDWYERADLFVLSSRYEGFPNVLLEAMATGCACLAFDCDTGPRDLIENEVNGVLVHPESLDCLSVEMNRLITNEKLRATLGGNAVKVRSEFSQDRIMSEWLAILNG